MFHYKTCICVIKRRVQVKFLRGPFSVEFVVSEHVKEQCVCVCVFPVVDWREMY